MVIKKIIFKGRRCEMIENYDEEERLFVKGMKLYLVIERGTDPEVAKMVQEDFIRFRQRMTAKVLRYHRRTDKLRADS